MKTILLLLSLCVSILCHAATKYISPTGNDVTGNGTITNPWQNFSYALNQSTYGDIIFFQTGTHFINSRVYVPVGISLEGVDSNTSIIKSNINALFVDILRFDQNAEGVNGNQHISNLQFDGRMTTQRAIHIRGRSNFSIYNCKFIDFVEKAVIFEGRTDNAFEAPPTIFSVNNSFHHNGVYNCANYPNGNYGSGQLNIGGQDGLLVYNNVMIQNQRPNGQNGWPIKYTTGGFNKNVKIHDNTLIKNKFLGNYGGDRDWDFAIELWFSLGGIEIYNNYVEGAIDLAYTVKEPSAAYSWWVHNNTITQPVLNDKVQHGIIFERALEGAIVENNTFDKVTCGVVINIEDFSPDRPLYQLLENVIIRKNVMTNLGRPTASGGANNGNNGCGIGVFVHNTALFDFNGLTIDNNTIVAAPNYRPFVGIFFNFDAIVGNPNNFYVRNNIVKDFYGEWLRTAGTNCTINGLTVQNNNPSGTGQFGNNNNALFLGNQPIGLINTNNITTNPQFVSTSNFQLQATSPCIDAGIYVGQVFNGNNPDIGAIEFGTITNIAPTVNAGADDTITLPTNTVNLVGIAIDTDGTIISYNWTKIAGPLAGTITNAATASTSVTGLNIAGTYTYELKVTDNNGAIGRDTIQVTVKPDPNVAPNANAGPDQSITLPVNTVNLIGSGNDPDGNITAYNWTKVAGPNAGVITNPNDSATTVTGLTIQGTYKYELRVTDNNGAIGRDTMQVTVNPAPNMIPTANAGPDQTITLPTSTITLSGSGTDPDGTITAYNWTKITGPTSGIITNANTAVTTVTALTQGTYRFVLRVTDNSGAFARDTINVIVNPDPNIHPIANAGQDQSITLPINTITLTGTGVDPDGTIISYNWSKIAGPNAGTFSNANAAITNVTALLAGTYRYELTVTDNNGAVGKDTMQLIVFAQNIPPIANAGPDKSITLPINSTNLEGSGIDTDGTITSYNWSKIAGPNAGIFSNANAAITAVTGLITGIYKYELTVTDNSGAVGKDTMQLIVFAQNILPIANAGPDKSITLPINSTNLEGSGIDSDGTITSYNWSKIAGPNAGTFSNANAAITAVNGLIAGIYKYELRVTDNSGAIARDTMQLVVFAQNIPPTANAGLNQSITLPTNTANLTGSGTDADGSITTYIWTKIAGPATGVISNNNAAVTTVTALSAGIYLFELRVIDNSGAIGKDTMQVTVNPENIAPLANAGADQTLNLPINKTTLNGSGTDVDGSIIDYTWRQIAGPPDKLTSIYTAVTSVANLFEGNYAFELTVTDNKGAKGKDTIHVIVKLPIAATQNSAKIYPNPVVDITTLDINTTVDVKDMLITITDMQGKMVYRKHIDALGYNTKEKINMSSLTSGTYYITVYFSSNQKQTIKAVKL